jgi:replicative DNA helicase
MGQIVEASFVPAQPPHDIVAEQALLGAILKSPEVLDRIASIVTGPEFYDPLHQAIFETCQAMRGEGKTPTPVTLRARFAHAEPIGDLHVDQYLVRLLRGVVSTVAARDYAEVVRDQWLRRLGSQAADALRTGMHTPTIEIASTLTDVAGTLNTMLMASRSSRDSWASLNDALGEVITHLDTTDDDLITTGIRQLDSMIGGWKRGELCVMAGRPSMGKSAVALSLARQTAARTGMGTIVFGMEMTRVAMAARIAADAGYSGPHDATAYQDIVNRRISANDRRHLDRTVTALSGVPLILDDQRGLTVVEIAARARRQKQVWADDGIVMGPIFVDHIGLIRAGERYGGQRHRELAEITDALACLAKDLDVPVVAMCQLNRGLEGRENKRPTLPDLRESGSIEENAESVMFVYRPAYYLERMTCDDANDEADRIANLEKHTNTLEIIVAKQRNGAIGTVKAFCDIRANAVRDLA